MKKKRENERWAKRLIEKSVSFWLNAEQVLRWVDAWTLLIVNFFGWADGRCEAIKSGRSVDWSVAKRPVVTVTAVKANRFWASAVARDHAITSSSVSAPTGSELMNKHKQIEIHSAVARSASLYEPRTTRSETLKGSNFLVSAFLLFPQFTLLLLCLVVSSLYSFVSTFRISFLSSS